MTGNYYGVKDQSRKSFRKGSCKGFPTYATLDGMTPSTLTTYSPAASPAAGDVLRQARLRQRYTQPFMALATGFTEKQVANWEAGRSPIKRAIVVTWAVTCGIDPDELIRDVAQALSGDPAREFGWIYEFTLFDMLGGETGDDATVVPLTLRPEAPIPRQEPVRRQDAA